jgi:hypothetical protein
MQTKLAWTLVGSFVVALLGCGARSTLEQPQPRPPDGGTDAGPDGGQGPLTVDCGPAERFTAPRRAITLEASVESEAGIATQGWTLTSSPPGSSPEVSPLGVASVSVTPDVEGSYALRFEATDTTGRRASCEVTVRAVVGPPVAICPTEDLRTTAGVPVIVMGDGFDDDFIVSFEWELVSAPPGAMPSLVGVDGPVLELTSTTLGRHVVRLTVTDPDMSRASCDAVVRVTGPPVVSCGEPVVRAPTRQPVTLRATASDDVGIASRRWEVLTRPSGSTASPVPPDAEVTTLTPDRRGEYRLRFTATDVEGLRASCEVTVVGIPTPPEVTCPMNVDTRPLVPVEITATAVDDGTIARWGWRLDTRPPGSDARAPSPSDAARTRFTPDIAGIYTLVVTAIDDDGMMGTCTTQVSAGNVDGLRVEMFWDTDGTDMDLHLLNPTGTRWVTPDDCYYANCNASSGRNLEWGAPGSDDNPRLDLDDTNGFGPENINITRPQPGTYRVAVHDFRSDRTNRVTVRIYCGGSTTTARATFGPALINRRGGASGRDFWRVVDVTIDAAGGCTVTDLSRGGAFWIEEYSATIGMR